ncbi:hypothetical protein BDZ91DRAFT_786032 [Kalaharituber pfeilii]|nr:hypothetical protein BDZ91DRAFT_786032 [Kalaharituber pfeilii]
MVGGGSLAWLGVNPKQAYNSVKTSQQLVGTWRLCTRRLFTQGFGAERELQLTRSCQNLFFKVTRGEAQLILSFHATGEDAGGGGLSTFPKPIQPGHRGKLHFALTSGGGGEDPSFSQGPIGFHVPGLSAAGDAMRGTAGLAYVNRSKWQVREVKGVFFTKTSELMLVSGAEGNLTPVSKKGLSGYSREPEPHFRSCEYDGAALPFFNFFLLLFLKSGDG